MSQLKITARDLIRRALTLVGVIGQRENPSSQEANDALLTLNEILDKWNTENLMIPYTMDIEIPLTGKSKYTLGETGDVLTRPNAGISKAYFIDGDLNFPATVLTKGQFDDIQSKNLNAEFISYVYYNGTYPNAELYVYPQSNKGKLILPIDGSLELITNLDTEISLPAGYIKALRYSLALGIAPEYGKELSPQILEEAIGAKNTIKANNHNQKKRTLKTDSALSAGGGFNFNTGEY